MGSRTRICLRGKRSGVPAGGPFTRKFWFRENRLRDFRPTNPAGGGDSDRADPPTARERQRSAPVPGQRGRGPEPGPRGQRPRPNRRTRAGPPGSGSVRQNPSCRKPGKATWSGTPVRAGDARSLARYRIGAPRTRAAGTPSQESFPGDRCSWVRRHRSRAAASRMTNRPAILDRMRPRRPFGRRPNLPRRSRPRRHRLL